MKQTIILLLMICNMGYGQKEDYVWMLGALHEITSIDFNDGMSMTRVDTDTEEIWMSSDVTTICTKEGELLFYSNGCRIYNKDHKLMPNGDSLLSPGWVFEEFCEGELGGDSAYDNNSIILPDPANDKGYYYVNSYTDLDFETYDVISDLRYTYVDFSEDSLGSISIKNKEIMPVSLYNLTNVDAVRHSNGKDWWILHCEKNGSTFYNVLIDSKGINVVDTFVVENAQRNISSSGQVCYSPDGNTFGSYSTSGLLLYDFDRSTGHLSNQRSYDIDTSLSTKGIAFSPNGRFVYCSSYKGLYQADLWHEGEDDFIQLIDTVVIKDYYRLPPSLTLMTLAPDCKIYISYGNGTYFWHVIHHPDRKGKQCQLEQGVALPFSNGIRTMPNHPNFRIDEPYICDSTITSITEIFESKVDHIEAYPNPASSHIRLSSPVLSYSIFDLSGNLRQQDNGNLIQEIPFDLLNSGMYFIHVKDLKGRTQYLKIMKM